MLAVGVLISRLAASLSRQRLANDSSGYCAEHGSVGICTALPIIFTDNNITGDVGRSIEMKFSPGLAISVGGFGLRLWRSFSEPQLVKNYISCRSIRRNSSFESVELLAVMRRNRTNHLRFDLAVRKMPQVAGPNRGISRILPTWLPAYLAS